MQYIQISIKKLKRVLEPRDQGAGVVGHEFEGRGTDLYLGLEKPVRLLEVVAAVDAALGRCFEY